MAYFPTFPTYSPQKQLPLGQPNRAIFVMFLAKNVMSFYLLDPMNGPHTWGKRTELYCEFKTASLPHEELQKPKSRTRRSTLRRTRCAAVNADVRIKESALKMSKRTTSGKLSTGNARRAALPLEKPLFSATTPLWRQNGLKMRVKPIKMGFTERLPRFLEHFTKLWTLRAGKQPRIRTRRSTLRRTTCRLTLIEILLCLTVPNTLLWVRRR